MGHRLVGTLKSLWRYPVKSMQGEALESSEVGVQGLLGDRAYALWDVQTHRIASAKNPKKWAALLDCQATLAQSPQAGEPIPPVQMTLPNGATLTSTQPDLNPLLSSWIEREVEFLTSVPESPSLDQYWPDVEGTAYQDTVTELFMPPGTFFDSCPIHAVTVATLEQLKEQYPAGEFEPFRFRPNLLIDTQAERAAFVEDDWIGHKLIIGESVMLQIDTACPRCVVTTLPQQGVPQDINILKTTLQYNKGIAGIRLSVLQGGTIQQGDSVWVDVDEP